MSRLIKKTIFIPEGVSVSLADKILTITGPRGSLNLNMISDVDVEINNNAIKINKKNNSQQAAMNSGTMWSLINNAILGVTFGFQKILEIEGIGFKAELGDGKLILNLGFSHPIEFNLPKEIECQVEKNQIIISGANKELVGRVAAQIRSFKPPEPYKGKGIHYKGEYIRRKAGKKAVGGA